MRAYGSGTIERYGEKFRSRGAKNADGIRPVIGIYNSREEAESACDEFALLVNQANVSPAGAMTLREWGRKYLERRNARNIVTDRNRWKLHIATAPFVDWPMRNIERRDIRDWLAALGRVKTADVRAKDPQKRQAPPGACQGSYRRRPASIA